MSRPGSPHGFDEDILIVTGSTLRAEDMDRPMAYCLRDRILEGLPFESDRKVHVLSDFRYLHEICCSAKHNQSPTISLGGPGVNALAQKWLQSVPFVLAVEDELFIQIEDRAESAQRASVWGVNHDATRLALATFVDNHLDQFLGIPAEKIENLS